MKLLTPKIFNLFAAAALALSTIVMVSCENETIPEDECNENPKGISCNSGILYNLDTLTDYVIGNEDNIYRCYIQFNTSDPLIRIIRDKKTLEENLICHLPPENLQLSDIDFCNYSILCGNVDFSADGDYVSSVEFRGECPDFFLKIVTRNGPVGVGADPTDPQFLYAIPVLPDTFSLYYRQEYYYNNNLNYVREVTLTH